MLRSIVFFSLSVLMLFKASAANADIVNEFVRIDCNRELNYLKISSFDVNGWLPANNAKRKKISYLKNMESSI